MFAEAVLAVALLQPVVIPGGLVQPIVIHAGERVRVTATIDGVEAVLTAIAEQSGRTGQTIRVVNPSSRRAIRVRVLAAGEVEVADAR